MQNITKNAPQGNMTGNRKISIAAIDEVKNIALTSMGTKSVTLKFGCTFGNIEAGDIEFSCKEDEGKHLIEIFCRLVSTQGKYDSLFNRMKHKRWVVIVIDNNNITWLAGTLTEPLRFRWEHIGEGKPCEQHCYELFFERQSTEPLHVANVYYTIRVDGHEREVPYPDKPLES